MKKKQPHGRKKKNSLNGDDKVFSMAPISLVVS